MVQRYIESVKDQGVEFEHPEIFSFFHIKGDFLSCHGLGYLCMLFEVMTMGFKEVLVDHDGIRSFCI